MHSSNTHLDSVSEAALDFINGVVEDFINLQKKVENRLL